MAEWIPMKDGLRWVAARCVQSWCLGSGYRYARDDKGRVVRFWRQRSAQQYADSLNAPKGDGGAE